MKAIVKETAEGGSWQSRSILSSSPSPENKATIKYRATLSKNNLKISYSTAKDIKTKHMKKSRRERDEIRCIHPQWERYHRHRGIPCGTRVSNLTSGYLALGMCTQTRAHKYLALKISGAYFWDSKEAIGNEHSILKNPMYKLIHSETQQRGSSLKSASAMSKGNLLILGCVLKEDEVFVGAFSGNGSTGEFHF